MTQKNYFGKSVPILRKDCKPVFFVGMNGSGTTMLLDCMGRHPALYAYPYETKIIPSLIESLKNYGDLDVDKNFFRLWKAIAENGAFTRANNGNPIPMPENWRGLPRNLAAVLDAIFCYFACREGKVRWCEKTPQHIQHMKALHHLFPSAKFVHIIRDGRDCAASINRRYKRTPEYSIYRWKKIVSFGRQEGILLKDKYMEVRYEGITSAPELWMRRICAFLELPFHENVLLSRHPKRAGRDTHGGQGKIYGGIEQNSAKWRTYFSEKQLLRLEEIAGAYLIELGYPVQKISGDANPYRVKLFFWRWKDYVNEFLSLVCRQMERGRKLNLSKLYKTVTVAIKQRRVNRY